MPAPTRYLIARPGASYSDVEDSTAKSAWVQPDDREASLAQVSADEPGELGGFVTIGDQFLDDPPVPADTFPLDAVVLAADVLDASDGGPYVDPPAAFWVDHSSWQEVTAAPGDDDPTGFKHGLAGGRTATGETLAANLAQTYFETSWITWPTDPRVIGYEVEQYEMPDGQWLAIGDPTSLTIQVTHAPVVANGVAFLDSRATVNGNWGEGPIDFSPAGLTVAVAAPSTISAALVESGLYVRSLSPFPELVPIDPVTYEYVIDDLSSSPPYTGLVGAFSVVVAAADGGLSGMDDNTIFQANANVSFAGTYTIRPPRIRWIYDRKPYRRIGQRGDGLAGGARRIGGGRTIQASNRRGAGAII